MSRSEPSFGSSAPLRPKRSRWARWAAEIGIFVLVVVAFQWWQARDVPYGSAPAFEAPMADGGSGSLAAWRSAHPGETVGVYFWAEWCPICKVQEGGVDALRADWPVLTVAMHSGDAAASGSRRCRLVSTCWATGRTDRSGKNGAEVRG